MSEYQIVKFCAVDRPLTDKQLEFMDCQSSRAKFSKWAYEVEYNYSSFRGDIDGMLRNGYDVFLSYSNYDGTEIGMRLPHGLPFPESVWSKYICVEGFTWTADESGKGGTLKFAPFIEEIEELGCDSDDYLDATAVLRKMLIVGDLRALYALWLCGAMYTNPDREALLEPPVPHGLGTFPGKVAGLFDLFEVDPLLIAAAAIDSPSFDGQSSRDDAIGAWLAAITESRRTDLVQRLLVEDPVALQAELLAEIRDSQQRVTWPVEPPTRTLAQLLATSESLRRMENEEQGKRIAAKAKHEAEKAEQHRQARMIEMRSSPSVWLEKASELVAERITDSYREAASILADLRDAIGGEEGRKIAHKHASHLAKKYPTLNMLKSSLRKKQLLD